MNITKNFARLCHQAGLFTGRSGLGQKVQVEEQKTKPLLNGVVPQGPVGLALNVLELERACKQLSTAEDALNVANAGLSAVDACYSVALDVTAVISNFKN